MELPLTKTHIETLSHLSFRQLNKRELGVDANEIWHRKLLVDYPDYAVDYSDYAGDYKDVYMEHMDDVVKKYIQFLRSKKMAYYIYYDSDKWSWIYDHGYKHTEPNEIIKIADLSETDRNILKLTSDITFKELIKAVEAFNSDISRYLKETVIPDNKIYLSRINGYRKTKGHIKGDDIIDAIYDCHNFLEYNDAGPRPLFEMTYDREEGCYAIIVSSTRDEPYDVDAYIKQWTSF